MSEPKKSEQKRSEQKKSEQNCSQQSELKNRKMSERNFSQQCELPYWKVSERKMSVLSFSCFSPQLLRPILLWHARIGPMPASLCSTRFRFSAADVSTQRNYLTAGLSAPSTDKDRAEADFVTAWTCSLLQCGQSAQSTSSWRPTVCQFVITSGWQKEPKSHCSRWKRTKK